MQSSVSQATAATPSAGVMLTEYYFSVFPTPDAQAAQLSDYTRRPYNQATTASGIIRNLEMWKVSIQIHRNVDAWAILEEDTLVFFKRIVAKLHGVSMTKEFLNPKKKQENTVKAITSGEPAPVKGAGKTKGKAPALPKKVWKGKEKERRVSDHKLQPLPRLTRVEKGRREMIKENQLWHRKDKRGSKKGVFNY